MAGVDDLDAGRPRCSPALPAIGAFAAWSSARAGREAVGRGNMPFVWPSYEIEYGEEDPEHFVPEINRVRVTLRNDGPGIAIDVKWSTWSPTDTPDRRWLPAQWRWLPRRVRRRLARWGRDSQADAATATSVSKAIRAMRPGQQETSAHTLQFLEGEPVWVVVRYTDSAGDQRERNGRPFEELVDSFAKHATEFDLEAERYAVLLRARAPVPVAHSDTPAEVRGLPVVDSREDDRLRPRTSNTWVRCPYPACRA